MDGGLPSIWIFAVTGAGAILVLLRLVLANRKRVGDYDGGPDSGGGLSWSDGGHGGGDSSCESGGSDGGDCGGSH